MRGEGVKELGVGDKIIALNSHTTAGYRKGDIIVVTDKSHLGCTGKNLTRENAYGLGYVFMANYIKWKTINDDDAISVFSLFGYTVTIRRKGD
ncbi:hypothetical protein [Bacillus phage vB_BanS-Thrax2]|nr:hypothetical protein [Bacillus phage vB_BanS-Thrax2]